MTAPEPHREVEQLLAALSRVADALYRIDAEPECRLLREPETLEGVSASLAKGLQGAFDRVWTEYPLAKEQADEHAATPATLLGTDFPSRVRALEADVGAILDAADEIGDAWRTALPLVDELRTVLRDVDGQAAAVDLHDDSELAHAHRLVDHLARQTARDPLSVDGRPASHAVAQVADRMGSLLRLREGLSSELASARTTLEEVRSAITEGQVALVTAREKVADPRGLLQPLDPSTLDRGDLALGPWLQRLEEEARGGEWLAAARGVEQWKKVAQGWLNNAERIVAANRGPVDHRNELRGRFDAYRAKAAATGRAEDRTLTDAAQRARAALHAAPCDLEEAERLVHEYARMVSEP